MGSLIQSVKMKLLIIFCTVFAISLAENKVEDTNQRFFGGFLNDLFGNGNYNQCNTCRYDSYEAERCCRNGIDRYCCNYINNNIGGSDYYPGNGGSDFNKPGYCPNNYGRKRRQTFEDGEGASRPGSNGGSFNRPGGSRPGYNGNDLHWNHNNNNQNNYGSCYSDRDCPGRQKCCRNNYGSSTC